MHSIILGSTIAGIEKALQLTAKGHSVTLTTETAYVGEDVTGTLRCFTGSDGEPAAESPLIPWEDRNTLEPWFRESDFRDESPLLIGKTKKHLLSMLEQAGVEVLFMTLPAGIWVDGGHLKGVLLGGKHGILRIRADAVIDATMNRTASFSFGGEPAKIQPGSTATYVLEYFDTDAAKLPGNIPEIDGRIHIGPIKPGHIYCEICHRIDSQSKQDTPRDLESGRTLMRGKALEAAHYLKANVPGFDRAYLAGLASYPTIETVNPPELDLSGFSCVDGFSGMNREESAGAPNSAPGNGEYLINGSRIPVSDCTIEPFDDPVYREMIEKVTLPMDALDSSNQGYTNRRKSDICIVGGGTAGTTAAMAAGDGEKEIEVLELFAYAGGTRTVGRVSGFYYGNRSAYHGELLMRLRRFSATINGKGREHTLGPSEMLYYEHVFREKGIAFRPYTVVADTYKVGNQGKGGAVEAVLAVSPYGVTLNRAKVYIDATGDADLAAQCGEPTDYGDAYMECIQNYSQWDRRTGCRYDDPSVGANKDQDVMDSRYLSEWNRSIRLNHALAAYEEMAGMLTVRESRRIRGKTTVTLRDVSRHVFFEDTVYVGCSDYDPHAVSFSDAGRLGLMPKHTDTYSVNIPLAALRPQNLDNVLTIGKGLAVEQEVLNYIRMNPDIQAVGHVAGLVAARVVEGDRLSEEILSDAFKKNLMQIGFIPHLWPKIPFPSTTAQGVECVVARIAGGDESGFEAAVKCEWPDTAGRLRTEWDAGRCRDTLLAGKTLMWFGDHVGEKELIEKLDTLDSLNGKAVYHDRHPSKSGDSLSGYLTDPDEYWLMNQLAMLLSKAERNEAVPVIASYIANTVSGGPAVNRETMYIAGRLDHQIIPNFDRVFAVIRSVEWMPDPSYTDALDALLQDEHIRGYVTEYPLAAQNRFYMSLLEVRLAYAATLCGSKLGRELLEAYTKDCHITLRKFAEKTLEQIDEKGHLIPHQ